MLCELKILIFIEIDGLQKGIFIFLSEENQKKNIKSLY